MSTILSVQSGKNGKRFERYSGADSYKESTGFLARRLKTPLEAASGFLAWNGVLPGDIGGAGSSNRKWWCVLEGSRLTYYGSASEVEPKGVVDLRGCRATAGGAGAFTITWPGSGTSATEFAAEPASAAKSWCAALACVNRVEQVKSRAAASDPSRPTSKDASFYGQPHPNALCFSIITSRDEPKGPVSFVAGSMREFEAWYTALHALAAQGLDAPAREARYRAASSAAPEDAALALLLGGVLEAQGKSDAALVEYRRSVDVEGRLAGARRAYGKGLLLWKRDVKGALLQLEAAASLTNREDPETLTLLGRAYVLDGAFADAAYCFELALALDPAAKANHIYLGECFAALERYDEAVQQFRASGQPGANFKLANVLAAVHRFDEAAEQYKASLSDAAVTVAPAVILEKLGACLGALHRWREVVSYATTALEMDPDSCDRLVAVARAYYEVGVAGLPGFVRPLPPLPLAPSSSQAGTPTRSVLGGEDGTERDSLLSARTPGSGVRGGAPPTPLPVGTIGLSGLAPPRSGSLPVDGMPPLDLFTAAESYLVQALTVAPESPHANILCGKVYEQLATLELAEAVAAGEPADTAADSVAPSGWSPNQRLEKVEGFYSYIAQAYPAVEFIEAPLRLSALLKSVQRYDEAIAYVDAVLDRDPTNTSALDLKKRLVRLAAGEPEVAVPAKAKTAKSVTESDTPGRKSSTVKKEEAELVAGGADLPTVDMTGMSEAERKRVFFKAMADKKRAEEEEKKKRETLRIASMTPDERAEFEKQKAEAAKHDAKKDRALTQGLAQYGGAAGKGVAAFRSAGGARGRGRGGGPKSPLA